MSAPKRERYHHGDLRTALIAAAVELIAERGVREFSLAEASRRLGVAASAPYAHFADRDDLLAAVTVHGLDLFQAELRQALSASRSPRNRLAMIVRTYVRFASAQPALYNALFQLNLDKTRHPELAAAERPIEGAFRTAIRAIRPACSASEEDALAAAIEAIAHGHATLLLDGRFGQDRRATERAASNAARSAIAAVTGWKENAAGNRTDQTNAASPSAQAGGPPRARAAG